MLHGELIHEDLTNFDITVNVFIYLPINDHNNYIIICHILRGMDSTSACQYLLDVLASYCFIAGDVYELVLSLKALF